MADPDDHSDPARRDPDVPPKEAGPRPGTHPSVARSGSSRSTAYVLIALFVGALAMYLLIAGGIISGPGG